MVDNENQWDDIEYSDGSETDNYEVSDMDGADYSDAEYEDQDGFDGYEDDDYQDGDNPKKSGGSPIILLILLIIVLGVAGFVFMNRKDSAVVNNDVNVVTTEQTSDPNDMGDYFFNEANGNNEDMMSVNFDENGNTNVVSQSEQGEVVATVKETPEENSEVNLNGEEENAIMVSYSRPVRLNPFKPTDEKPVKALSSILNDTGFEIIEPPTASVPDENLTKLLQIQISGILYDAKSPSAIVNLDGSDQFVKIGDNIGGYTIDGITRDQVQISYRNNTYVASVGQLFTRGELEKRQAVANLENKFAGRNRN